jgi:hypothetical protein
MVEQSVEGDVIGDELVSKRGSSGRALHFE